MQYSKKIDQFKVSIRRRHLNEKIANLRVKNQGFQSQISNVEEVILNIKSLFSTATMEELYIRVEELKRYSQNGKVVSVLKDYFQGFYRLLVEVDSFYSTKPEKADQIYSTICTILINILSLEVIDFSEEIKQDIASPIIKNIKKKQRQTDTLWFIANILYRKNRLSNHFMECLVKEKISEYISKRMDIPFEAQSVATIFYYFVGGLTGNLGFVNNFNDFKTILKEINNLANLQIEQCYLYILDGLNLYAFEFNKHQYQIFSTTLLKKCDVYCINKKSRFVKKYLEVIVSFISGEATLLHNSAEEIKKKMVVQQYERFKKNNILKNMQYCLENRSPEVKKLLLEAACILVTIYFCQIDLSLEYFYLTLAEQINNIDKHDKNIIFSLLKYMEILIIALLKVGNISKHSEYSESFLKFIESNCLFQKIQYVVRNHGQFQELLNLCLDIIAYLQEYEIPSLVQALRRTNLLSVLESLEIDQPELSKKRDILVEYIGPHNGGEKMEI